MTFFKKEKFRADVGVGLTDEFAPLLTPSVRRIDIATDVINPKDSYVMQVFVPKNYASLKIDCRSSLLYPVKRTVTPKYHVYEEAANDMRKVIKDKFPSTTFEVLKTSTVRDGGENTDRYELNFLACPSCGGATAETDELPLLISLISPSTARIKYSNESYRIRTRNGNIEITNKATDEVIKRPEF